MTMRRTAIVWLVMLAAAAPGCGGGGTADATDSTETFEVDDDALDMPSDRIDVDAAEESLDAVCDPVECEASCPHDTGGPPYGVCADGHCYCTHTDPGGDDAGGGDDAAEPDDVGDAGDVPASLTLAYADPCPCYPPPCCPTTTLTFSPGSAAAWYLMCGDAVACDPPPVGWERQATDGTWERIVTPGESAGAGFLCAPGNWSDLGMYSIPSPPSGTVRAVGLFDDECGLAPATCATRCGAPREVLSNPVVFP
jgi:hypothetical protein